MRHVIDISFENSTTIATIYVPYPGSLVVLYLGDEKAWHINNYRTLRGLVNNLLSPIYADMEHAAHRAGLIGAVTQAEAGPEVQPD